MNIENAMFTISLTRFTLYLSSEGDSVQITDSEKDDETNPEQMQALACKTHKQVLDFLEQLRDSKNTSDFTFLHYQNTKYSEHTGHDVQDMTHSCPLEKLIDFVRDKISETTQRSGKSSRERCTIL